MRAALTLPASARHEGPRNASGSGNTDKATQLTIIFHSVCLSELFPFGADLGDMGPAVLSCAGGAPAHLLPRPGPLTTSPGPADPVAAVP